MNVVPSVLPFILVCFWGLERVTIGFMVHNAFPLLLELKKIAQYPTYTQLSNLDRSVSQLIFLPNHLAIFDIRYP